MTSQRPAPLSPATPPVRRLSPADLPACLDLAADRGWTREEHKWRLLLSAGRGFGIDAPPHEGGPARGLIACLVMTPYADDHHCVSMVLVAGRHARRGIGRHLMTRALDACAPGVFFLSATRNGRPLYERLGFRAVGSLTVLRGPFHGTAPGVPGIGVRPARAADLPAVLAYDRPVFGADRTGLLTRLPAFADGFLVAETADGRLAGFGARWPNVTTTVIGPVLADGEDIARALIARLAAASALPVRLDADARHPGLAAWARAAGLTGDDVLSLMVRGAPDIPGDITRRFAPYSVALG